MLMLAILWACSSSTPEPDAPAEPTTGDAEREALRAHMQGHLTAVSTVREALVRCDLDAAKQANREFLDHKVAFDLPGDWVTHVGAMGEAAVALDAATEHPEAVAQAARMAAACGGCHGAVGAEIKLPLPPVDPSDEAATNARRLQAIWNALIVPPAPSAPGPEQAARTLLKASACEATPTP